MHILTLRAASAGKRRQVDWLPVLLILPALALTAMLLFYPIARGIQASFFDVTLLNPGRGKFVGVDNYLTLVQASSFWNSLRVTTVYTLGVVILAYSIGLGTALLLSQRFIFRGLLRTLMIIPWAVPEVVTVLIFTWMFDAQYGVINFFLMKLGLIERQLAWLVLPELALPALIVVTVWKQFPIATLILLAGLQTISQEYYEAAAIDGASALQRFRFITWPGLRAVNIVLILILILYSFRRVTLIYAMTAGGPARATETLSVQTYLEAFKFFNLGNAAALGTVLLLLLLAFTVVYFRITYGSRTSQP
jgi:multiple sugar transport system permease protein